MTSPPLAAAPSPAGSPSAPSSPRGRRPRRRTVVTGLVLLASLALLVVAALVTGGGDRQVGGRLDPTDAGPDGARALARVLEQEGVDVEVVRDRAALDAADVDADTTVLVSDPAYLGRSQAEDLRDGDAARVVVADPYDGVPQLFGVEPGRPAYDPGVVEASCGTDPGVDLDDLEVEVRVGVTFADADGCFETDEGVLLAVDGDVVLLGVSDALTNGQVLEADNAALALRLLGATERLVWYVPDPADLEEDDGVGIDTFLPDWLPWSGWLLVALVGTVAVWRGRRLGPLATEPLPVEVRAVEATEARGRLYRRSRDPRHAARTLRDAARRRVAQHLSHPRGTPARDLVLDVAGRTGWPAGLVGALLDPDMPLPTDDATLVAFARQLTDLEKEVRRT